MADLESVRLILAETLEELAIGEFQQFHEDRGFRLFGGAKTLRWAHRFEDGDEALRERIADLEAEVEALENSESELTEERDKLQVELAKCRKEIPETAAA